MGLKDAAKKVGVSRESVSGVRDLHMPKQTVSRHIIALLLGYSAIGAHSSSAQENKGVTPKSGFVTLPDGIKIH